MEGTKFLILEALLATLFKLDFFEQFVLLFATSTSTRTSNSPKNYLLKNIVEKLFLNRFRLIIVHVKIYMCYCCIKIKIYIKIYKTKQTNMFSCCHILCCKVEPSCPLNYVINPADNYCRFPIIYIEEVCLKLKNSLTHCNPHVSSLYSNSPVIPLTVTLWALSSA